MSRSRRVTVALLVVYLLVLARITLWPSLGPDDGFDVVRAVLAWLDDHGIPLTYSATELVANIVLFVPFGVLVGLLRGRTWVVVALGLATSLVIETTQLLLLPDRVADVRDLLANTLGTAVGLGVLVLADRRRQRGQGRPSAR